MLDSIAYVFLILQTYVYLGIRQLFCVMLGRAHKMGNEASIDQSVRLVLMATLPATVQSEKGGNPRNEIIVVWVWGKRVV